jgi:Flp pilus assembly protein CpaB
MKPKNMILLIVAIGCGLAASYLTSQLLANRDKTVPTVKVLVAKKRVPAYTLLKDPESLFVEKEYPENVAPKKAITNFADAKDKRTNKVLNDEVILLGDDLADAKTEGLPAQLPPGERGISINVNAQKSVAGFVLPGSRVDVAATLNVDGTGKEAKIILQNMLVLAVDTKDTKEADQRSIIGQTVTLSAKPEEAMRLLLAQSMGDLQLILRPFGDRDTASVKPVRVKDLDNPLVASNSDAKEDEAAPARSAAPLVPVLPAVVKATAPEEKEKVEEKPAAPPVPEKRIETHTIWIQSGENIQKAIFTREEGDPSWKHGQIGRAQDETGEGALEAMRLGGGGSEQPAESKPARRGPAKSQAVKPGI